MKAILSLVILFVAVVACHGSYYEDWIIEARVLSVYGKERTAKIRADHPDINVEGAHFSGLQIKLTKCTSTGGHGRTKCKTGMTQVIVLSYDPKLMKRPPAKGMLLKIRYSYSDSAVPEGEPWQSNIWQLIAVLGKPDGDEKEKAQK